MVVEIKWAKFVSWLLAQIRFSLSKISVELRMCDDFFRVAVHHRQRLRSKLRGKIDFFSSFSRMTKTTIDSAVTIIQSPPFTVWNDVPQTQWINQRSNYIRSDSLYSIHSERKNWKTTSYKRLHCCIEANINCTEWKVKYFYEKKSAIDFAAICYRNNWCA